MTPDQERLWHVVRRVMSRVWSKHKVDLGYDFDQRGLELRVSGDGAELLVADWRAQGAVPPERVLRDQRQCRDVPVIMSVAVPPGLRGPGGVQDWERECEEFGDALFAEMERRHPGRWRGGRRKPSSFR